MKKGRGRGCGVSIAAALLLWAAGFATWAAQPPDAGQVLDTLKSPPALPAGKSNPLPTESGDRPALSAPDSLKIPVKGFRIAGARAFPESELQALVQDGVGKELTLSELDASIRRITAYYRNHGYLLARAYIPAQDILDGVVEIVVLEGRLGKINLENGSAVASGVIDKHLAALESGKAVEDSSMERPLLLLNDLPGVEVRSTLKPGASVGTSDLDVKVIGTGRVTGNIDADNFGNRYIGDLRLGATMNVNSLAGLGDVLTFRGTDSGPGMSYGRLAWQTPVGGNGLKLGAAWSDLRYKLQKEFAPLLAHGSADIGTLWASYPFLRSQAANVNGQLAYDRKKLEDRVDSTLTLTQKTIDAWTFGISGDRLDSLGRGGLSTYNASWVAGHLALNPDAALIDQGAGGHQTEGSYGKLAFTAARSQRLAGNFALYGALSGQYGTKNLDSSEKFSLGGAYGVRAYAQGEAAGDDAWLATLELRYTIPNAPDVQVFGFIDDGFSRIVHSPLVADTNNRRHLLGDGLGVQWLKAGDFALKAFVAWRGGAQPVSDVDRHPRVWLQMVKYF